MCHKKQVLLDDEDGVAHGTLVPDCEPACVLSQDQYNQWQPEILHDVALAPTIE